LTVGHLPKVLALPRRHEGVFVQLPLPLDPVHFLLRGYDGNKNRKSCTHFFSGRQAGRQVSHSTKINQKSYTKRAPLSQFEGSAVFQLHL
jgi:hypothetical protein